MTEPANLPAALAGLRILDLTDATGAYGARLLGDLGAEVIKIEPPGGSLDRRARPADGDAPSAPSLTFVHDNLGKRSVTLDLDAPAGQDLFRRLAATADALIETRPPGHLTERGLGYADLAAINPQLVYTSLTPFGQSGPAAHFQVTPLVALALGGLLSTMGYPEGPPLQAGVPLAYILAGQHAAAFTQIALFGRRVTGRGQQIDVSMQACVAAAVDGPLQVYLLSGAVYPRIGAVRVLEPPNGTYACRDGHFCMFILNWPGLAAWIARVLDDESLLDPKYDTPNNALRAPYAGDIIPRVEEFCRRLTRAELLDGIHRTGQIGGPILTPPEVLDDPHLAAREYFVTRDLPGLGSVRLPGAPYRLSATPWRCPDTIAAAGADTAAILSGDLGLDPAEIDRLRSAGVI